MTVLAPERSRSTADCCPSYAAELAAKRANTDVTISALDAWRMDEVVAAVNRVTATALYQQTALRVAPPIARDTIQRVKGLFNGFDFHLTPAGPKLIEVNTNAGGAFYGALIDQIGWNEGNADAHPLGAWAQLFVQHFRAEWAPAGQGKLRTVAIVDDNPQDQFLILEFELAAQMLRDAGIGAVIADPRDLAFRDGRLWHGTTPIDFVYNRLTSFALDRAEDAAIRDALLAGAVVVSPDPRTHALFACKRNLTLLGDDAFLRDTGIDEATLQTLIEAIPRTVVLTPSNAGDFWSNRERFYFKPMNGFGSRAVYDGAKLTAATWTQIAARTDYVAQERVDAERVEVAGHEPMRFDVRTFAYGASPFMRLARVYRGQTTNFRTPGGGFAPVRVRA
ncbi:MAG: hypothetical protein ABL996_23975 [Micropepsaceae bacterium]